MITNQQLRDAYLSPQMAFYFERKLAPLPTEDVRVRIEEALKFLGMAADCNGDIPVSNEIDEVWHLWILETAEYDLLCSRLPHGVFLHHSSNDYALYTDPGAKERKTARDAGVAILASYVLNYGPFAIDRVKYWPFAARMMELMGWPLAQLNDWLAATRIAEVLS